ncbi:MAG TPA: type II toxin-antitoxin system VapC family toxin [Acidimicrobiia bacterium]
MAEKLVIDASAMVDYLVGSPLAGRVAERITDNEIFVPAHFDAEVLSALGRLQRGGVLSEAQVEERLALTAQAPFHRELLGPLLEGAWARHHNVRLVDALYIELANRVDATLITTDSGMSAASDDAEHIE